MRDERGLYYHPQPGNPKVRVYVRAGKGAEVEFRLWQAEYPEVWEKHEWIPLDVIHKAAQLYRERGRGPLQGNPLALYDETVAKALLQER
ncbi:MAG: hypothetical protein FWG59_04925 [Betaproteobacteria bacterium]|nr:hypothetical protein [Betaproteobacteria bacterium]